MFNIYYLLFINLQTSITIDYERMVHNMGENVIEQVFGKDVFNDDVMREKLPKDVVVGILERSAIKIPDLHPYYHESIATWKQLREELFEYGFMEATPQELQESRDRLFRPLLVDGLAMMKLLKQQELVIWLEAIQRQYLSTFQRSQTVRLVDEIDYSMIDKAIERIVEIITAKMQCSYTD